jgi:hypothetical protein
MACSAAATSRDLAHPRDIALSSLDHAARRRSLGDRADNDLTADQLISNKVGQ